jgi:hypothetical protein
LSPPAVADSPPAAFVAVPEQAAQALAGQGAAVPVTLAAVPEAPAVIPPAAVDVDSGSGSGTGCEPVRAAARVGKGGAAAAPRPAPGRPAVAGRGRKPSSPVVCDACFADEAPPVALPLSAPKVAAGSTAWDLSTTQEAVARLFGATWKRLNQRRKQPPGP